MLSGGRFAIDCRNGCGLLFSGGGERREDALLPGGAAEVASATSTASASTS